MTKICKNCGHEKKRHNDKYGCFADIPNNKYCCGCNNYEEDDWFINLGKECDEALKKPKKQPKGCGKCKPNENCICKEFKLKPILLPKNQMTDKELYESTLGKPWDKKPKNHKITKVISDKFRRNHSPSVKCLKDTPSGNSHLDNKSSETIQPEGTHSQDKPRGTRTAANGQDGGSDTPGTFNLSDKEFHSLDADKRAYYKEDIKTFIKKLKEYNKGLPIYIENQLNKKIDKLAGEDLI